MKLLPFLALLSGCIIYDHTGKFGHDDQDDSAVDSDPGTTTLTVTDTQSVDDTGTTSNPGEVSFTLDPSVGVIGTTFIASLTATNFDLNTVANEQFYGEVQVLAAQNRGSEILFTLSIPATAKPGTADLLLELKDGTAQFLPKVLTLSVDGSDRSDTGGDPSTGDTGKDTGNPCQ